MNFALQNLTKGMCPVTGSNVVKPDFSIFILNEGRRDPAFLVESQSPVDKVSQTGLSSKPEAAIPGAQHGIARGQFLSGARAPANELHTVKPEEPALSSDPDVPICSLRDSHWGSS
jgi:hypothetical protein